MAALSISLSFRSRNCLTQELIKIRSCERSLITLSSQSRLPIDRLSSETKKEKDKDKDKDKKPLLPKLFLSVGNFGRRLKDNLSPRQKGDWKDLMLMSLSFAVYIYISQKIVCAYCAWMSMLKQPW